MPTHQHIQRLPERLALASMICQMCHTIQRVHFPRYRFGTVLEAIPVGLCVFQAQAAGRPMTASQVATALEMPRNTAARKLGLLHHLGLVEKHGRVYVVVPDRVNRPEVLKEFEKLMDLFRRTSNEIEKMSKMEQLSA